MRDFKQLISIADFIKDIYLRNQSPKDRYYAVCERYANITKMITNTSFTIFAISGLTFTLSLTVASIVSGELKPSMYVYFPGVHEYSNCLMAMLLLYNFALAIATVLISPPGDVFFFFIFSNIPMIPDIIQGQLDEMTAALEVKKRPINLIDIKCRIWQFLKMQKKYEE